MKVNKSLIIGLLLLIAGGLGSILWFSFNTIIENKINNESIQNNQVILNNKFDTFIALHSSQNIELNKRIDGIKDSLAKQGERNNQGHDEIIHKVNNIIYIEKKTDKNFRELWNTINLTVR